MRELATGVRMLVSGFARWRTHPRTMALGLVPAAIVAAVMLAGIVVLAVLLPGLTATLTPFADGWPGIWALLIRLTIGTAVLGAALVLAAVTFTALTLIVGDPFYERIWRAVEDDLGEAPTGPGEGFWLGVGDGLRIVARGLVAGAVAALIGFVPVVGSVAGAIVGVVLAGRLLAEELCTRALSARGIRRAERRALLRAAPWRVLGFGVATQLCFLVPLGAIAVMPAAVAGGTALARSTLPAPA